MNNSPYDSTTIDTNSYKNSPGGIKGQIINSTESEQFLSSSNGEKMDPNMLQENGNYSHHNSANMPNMTHYSVPDQHQSHDKTVYKCGMPSANAFLSIAEKIDPEYAQEKVNGAYKSGFLNTTIASRYGNNPAPVPRGISASATSTSPTASGSSKNSVPNPNQVQIRHANQHKHNQESYRKSIIVNNEIANDDKQTFENFLKTNTRLHQISVPEMSQNQQPQQVTSTTHVGHESYNINLAQVSPTPRISRMVGSGTVITHSTPKMSSGPDEKWSTGYNIKRNATTGEAVSYV